MDDIKTVILEAIQAVLPISLLIVILQIFLFPSPLPEILQFLIGAILVTLGLGLFLIGIKVGIMPMGETIGAKLTEHGSLVLLVLFALFLGFAVTMADPGVRVLGYQFDLATGGDISKTILIASVALGLGVCVALGVARIILGIPISYLFIGGFVLIFILAAFTPASFVPIAFDAGGVTTGPMTVPFVIALGVGLTSVLAGKSSLGDSFGLVGLGTIGPILAMMLLGVIYG